MNVTDCFTSSYAEARRKFRPAAELASRQARAIKAQIRAAIYLDMDDWKIMVLHRSVDMPGRALRGLTRS